MAEAEETLCFVVQNNRIKQEKRWNSVWNDKQLRGNNEVTHWKHLQKKLVPTVLEIKIANATSTQWKKFKDDFVRIVDRYS